MPPDDIGAFEPASRDRHGGLAAALTAHAAHMQRLVARQAREIEVLKADHRVNLANLSRATDEQDRAHRHERHQALVEAEAERNRLRAQLETITHSVSWKITARIRAFGKLSRAAVRRLRPAPSDHRPERAIQAAETPSLQIPALAIDPRTGVPALADPREAVAEPGRGEDPDIWPIDRPLVSVVITSFNYGRYLEQCVELRPRADVHGPRGHCRRRRVDGRDVAADRLCTRPAPRAGDRAGDAASCRREPQFRDQSRPGQIRMLSRRR